MCAKGFWQKTKPPLQICNEKNKWESFSSRLQWSQFWFILVDKLPARAPVAMALLMSLQAKHLLGDKILRAHTLFIMFFTCAVILLAPWDGRCTYSRALRNLKAFFVEHTPMLAGFHLTISMLSEGTCTVWDMIAAVLLSKIWEMNSLSQFWVLGI